MVRKTICMNKQVTKAFGKKVYLLGKDKEKPTIFYHNLLIGLDASKQYDFFVAVWWKIAQI